MFSSDSVKESVDEFQSDGIAMVSMAMWSAFGGFDWRRYGTPTIIDHGVVGADIARKLGYPEKVARIIEVHECGGLSPEEARELKLEEKYVRRYLIRRTWEEKVVVFADCMMHCVPYMEIYGDPWKDGEALARSIFTYNNMVFQKIAGHSITMKHRSIQQMVDLNREIIKYCRKSDFKGISGKHLDTYPGLRVSDAYEKYGPRNS